MSHNAKVYWQTAEEGGRTSLPTSGRYVNIARFPEDGTTWPDGAWSVVLEFETPPSQQGATSVGTVRFLAEDAPHDRLHAGRRFEVYEGTRHTASVEVLS
jgi:hypothetical protein